jgi:CRP-like cAMP-binding protein
MTTTQGAGKRVSGVEDLSQDPALLVERFNDPTWGAQRLRDISLFARFTDDELAMMYSMGKLSRLKPSAHAVIEGEPTRGMFLLLSGRVSVYKTDPSNGSMVRLAILEEGAAFGELSLFDSAPRSATVAADNACYLFQLDADAFSQFLADAGDDLQVRFFKTCAEELAMRFRMLNRDYINSQRLLWKHALRKTA